VTEPNWQTIPEMVLSAADRFGDAEAVVDGPLRLTFTELVERIRCAAGAFDELGVAKGKKLHDKRETEKQRDWQRDKARLMRDKG